MTTVSICITTYNHEPFIAQALDSVLAQQFSDPIEIIVSDDYSADRTAEIVRQYAEKYADKLILTYPPTREKLIIDGHTTGRINYLHALGHCRGKYIALLDGDDYWTDPLKLRRQIDFLEQNPDFSVIFHNVYCVQNEQVIRKYLDAVPEESMLDAQMIYQNLIPTCSVVFRNNLPETFPEIFYRTKFGDWPLHIYNLNYGRIAYLDEISAAYRLGSGIWSGQQMLDRLNANLAFYKTVETLVPARLRHHIACASSYQHLLIFSEHVKSMRWGAAMRALLNGLRPLCLFNASFRSLLKPILRRRLARVGVSGTL